MKKHLTSLLAGAALALLAGGASAQWYDAPVERPLSPREIRFSLEDRGYDVLGPPRFRSGPGLYIADAIDRRGRRVRVTVDAFDGSVVERVTVERDRRRFERDGEAWRPSAPRPGRPRFEDRDDDAVDWGEEIARRPRSMVEPPRQRFASRPDPREAVPETRLPNRAPLPPTRPPALVETPGAKPAEPEMSVAQRASEPWIDVPALPEVDAVTRTPRDLTPEERQEIIPALPQASGG